MLDLLKIFLTVVEKKTYTKAGIALGMTHSTVSRKMAKLEEILRVELVKAYPTGVVLTDEGQKLALSAADLCGRSERMIAEVRSAAPSHEGELKVLASNFGVIWLADIFKEFEKAHPHIKLDIRKDDCRDVLYVGKTSGVFLGLTSLPPPEDTVFVWKRLGSYFTFPFAHPSYLEKYGTPQTFADLDHHHLIRYRWAAEFSDLEEKASNVLLYAGRDKGQGPRDHVFTTDDTLCCKEFIQAGAGIGMIPRYQARNTDLVELFRESSRLERGHKTTIHLVYPEYLRKNTRVQTLRGFIQEKVNGAPGRWLDEGS